MLEKSMLSRREFLRLATGTAAVGLLAACAPKAPAPAEEAEPSEVTSEEV